MKEPPGRRIIQCHDASGFPAIQWEVLPRPTSRLIGCLLVVAAGVFVFNGATFPTEFWGQVKEWKTGNPDWLGLIITGGGTLFFFVPAIAITVLAYLVLFRSQPERFILEGWRLIYEPGSALSAMGSGDSFDRKVMWRLLTGRGRFEVSKDQFGGAAIGSRKSRTYVVLDCGKSQWRAGQFLNRREQQELIAKLTEWKRRG